MEKFRYYSFTLESWVEVYAVIGETEVVMFEKDLTDFGTLEKSIWDKKQAKGYIKEGWE